MAMGNLLGRSGQHALLQSFPLCSAEVSFAQRWQRWQGHTACQLSLFLQVSWLSAVVPHVPSIRLVRCRPPLWRLQSKVGLKWGCGEWLPLPRQGLT